MEYERPSAIENHTVPQWPDPEWRPEKPLGQPPPDPPPERPAAKHAPRTRKHKHKRGLASGREDKPAKIGQGKRSFISIILLQIAGLCCYGILIGLAALAWGYIVYSSRGYISGEESLSVYIFFGAIFLSSCLITALSRGGAIFPALLFSLLANGASFLLTELSTPPFSGLLLKVGFSLLIAAVAFTLTKLLIISGRRGKLRT